MAKIRVAAKFFDCIGIIVTYCTFYLIITLKYALYSIKCTHLLLLTFLHTYIEYFTYHGFHRFLLLFRPQKVIELKSLPSKKCLKRDATPVSTIRSCAGSVIWRIPVYSPSKLDFLPPYIIISHCSTNTMTVECLSIIDCSVLAACTLVCYWSHKGFV